MTTQPVALDPVTPEPGQPIPVDVRSLLAWTNRQIVAFRRAMRHRHDDDAWWEERGLTPQWVQAGRAMLRQVAHLLHVERANRRDRIHGNFESLEKQREWLAAWETRSCSTAARYLGVPYKTNLIALRAGEVVQHRGTDWCIEIDLRDREGIESHTDEVQS